MGDGAGGLRGLESMSSLHVGERRCFDAAERMGKSAHLTMLAWRTRQNRRIAWEAASGVGLLQKDVRCTLRRPRGGSNMGQFSAENPCRPGQHSEEIQSNTPTI